MASFRSRRQKTQRRLGALAALALCLAAGTALGAEKDEWAGNVWDALIQGTPTLDFRTRVEIADSDTAGLEQAEGYTFRTRLGYGTKPYEGISLYGDFENVAAIAASQYFSGVGANQHSKSTIADPKGTEVNQVYMKIARQDLLYSTLIGGRQRITLDDQRFVGNVGWRQNEQTFDAAVLMTSLGVEDLQLIYGFVGNVHQTNFNTLSARMHAFHGSWAGFKPVKLTGFVYLYDVIDAPAASNMTFGVRGVGSRDLNDETSIGYQASYAYQQDYENQPVSYAAHYFLGDVNVGYKPLATLGVGYEMLGSDDGTKQFQTPTATFHSFNGWADVFAGNNGGVKGLRDLHPYLAPKLPNKFEGKLVYHRFWSDDGGDALGNEYDAMLSRPINKHLDLLTKFAYFDTSDSAVLPDLWRWWLMATVKF